MHIVYLHGLNQTSHSFNYLRTQLPAHTATCINYSSHQALRDSMQEIRKQLPKGEFSLVGHSLGGVLAVLMAAEHAEHADQMQRLVTISSPFAGSKVAAGLRWLPGHPKVIEDLTPSSPKIELIRQLRLTTPTMCLVSTAGALPLSSEPNDGIVTVSSQKALPFGKKAEVKANHFEVLLHERTIKLMRDFLFGDAE